MMVNFTIVYSCNQQIEVIKGALLFDNFVKYKTFVKVKYYADYKHNLKLKL